MGGRPPKSGGLTFDAYVVACARRFRWPPSVTREQAIRDLELIFESLGDGDGDTGSEEVG